MECCLAVLPAFSRPGVVSGIESREIGFHFLLNIS
jgi:hypothetical protein